jgi:LCP family protein required for cell wall assembly
VTRRRPTVVGIVVSVLVVAAAAIGLGVVLKAAVLPPMMAVLVVAADVVLSLGVVALLLLSGPRHHSVRFWVAVVLAVLLVVGNGVMAKVGTDYLTTVDKIQPPSTQTEAYDIVVLNTGAEAVDQLASTKMGEADADELADAVHEGVAGIVDVTYETYPMWQDLITALENKDVTSIVIRDAYMQVLQDAEPDRFDSLRVLKTFEVDQSRAVWPKGETPTPTPTATPTPVAPSNAYIVYISGIDQYGSIGGKGRSDVNILMVINPTTGKVLLVNTPRDYYVKLHGKTGLPDKLTHAGAYGIDVSVGTLQDLYDITIDYYLRINFDSLMTIIDAVGGVDVDSAYDFTSRGYTFHVGMNHMDGATALAFSRARYNFADGDRTRGKNQEQVITSLIKKLSSPAVLGGYNRIVSGVQNSIQTSMPPDVISAQVRQQLSSNQSWTVDSISVDGAGKLDYTWSYPGQRLYVMVPDQATVDAAKAAIQATLAGQ